MSTSPRELRSHLLSHLRADQSQRWQQGQSVRVEHYLEQYPDLADNQDALLNLILAEIMLREQRGDTPPLEEYLQRFPAHADSLRQQWQLRRLLHLARQDPFESNPEGSTVSEEEVSQTSSWKLPGFEVLQELGRGGMGVVLQARQLDLDRIVAVKLIRSGPLAGDEELARFRTEARAVARLLHPGVVQVYDLRVHDKCPYLVMEYLPGGNLLSRLQAQGPLPLRECALLIRDLARAVQAAHQANVLHRDLKPSNVLFGADQVPRICDFGLARLLDDEQGHTRSEMVLGTPAYMSPEQAVGQMRHVGKAADIWALGAIFYECLVGHPAFKGESRSETLAQVQHADPPSLHRQRPEIPDDLEAICLKCLEKAPQDRYASADALADDLDRWLQGESVLARPASRWRKGWRHLRRHPQVAALLISAPILLLLGSILWPGQKPQKDDPKSPEPELSVRELEAHLRQLQPGQKQILLAPKAKPVWSHWVLGEATQTRHRDGSFRLETWTDSLLLLLRNPQRDSFRFRALIRHETNQSGQVGLFVGLHNFTLGNDQMPFYLEATFNDVEDEEQKFREALQKTLKGAPLPPIAKLNGVLLTGVFELGKGQRGAGSKSFQCFLKPFFKVRPPQQPQWRPFALVVTPQRLRVYFEDKLVGEVDASWIDNRAAQAWNNLAKTHPELVGLPCPARYTPRGGLGLSIKHGSASFKDVVLEPWNE